LNGPGKTLNETGCEHPKQTSVIGTGFGLPIPGARLANLLAPYDAPDPVCHTLLPLSLEKALSPPDEENGADRRPQFEVADIFRLYGEAYRSTHALTSEQAGVMYAIANCRTATYGFHTDVCNGCAYIESAYNSCRNRHCPKCQGIARRRWVNTRLEELLPAAYHHAVFTLPNALSVLGLHNSRRIYDLLFDAASQTLLAFGHDPKWLGAQIGFYGILHTWSQTLWPHVHLHLIVTAGGLSDDGRWIEPKYKTKFLFPVKALSKVFRGKFIQGLKQLYYAGDLILTDDLQIDHPAAFEMWLDHLAARHWVVYSKAPFAGPEEVVQYIGRYTHRVAITNHRILGIDDGLIRFAYKDNKEQDKASLWKEMTLPADQFITRFLWHVLPKGYHRIRHYGFLNNGQKHANLAKIREILAARIEEKHADSRSESVSAEDVHGMPCPRCETGRLRPFLVTDGHGRVLKCEVSAFPGHTEGKYDDTS
jgi:hypothetical protein